MLLTEGHFFNLKNSEGEEYKIEDFVEILYWDDDGKIEIDGVDVSKIGSLSEITFFCSPPSWIELRET